MAFASSSLVSIAYVEESTFGEVPTSGNHRLLRMTGETLTFDVTKEQSQEINSSRSVSSQIPVSASASGSVETEISYREYDAFIEAALQGTWNVFGTNGVSATATVDFTATTMTASVATAGTSDWSTLRPGQFFRVNSTGPSLNRGKILRVSQLVAPTSTVITLDASTPAEIEAAIADVTIGTSWVTHGINQRSFTLERQSPDINEYWAYTGMTLSTMAISMAAAARSTFSFGFMGKGTTRAVATQMPGTRQDSYAFDIHSGATGPVCVIWVDGAPLVGTYVQSISMNYDNALREQLALCEFGAVGIGSGTINLTGSMEVYFANGALYDKFRDNVNIAVTFSTLDNDGNGYVFHLPKVNLSTVGVNAGAKDEDMVLSFEYAALRDLGNTNPTLRRVIFVDRVGVAAV